LKLGDWGRGKEDAAQSKGLKVEGQKSKRRLRGLFFASPNIKYPITNIFFFSSSFASRADGDKWAAPAVRALPFFGFYFKDAAALGRIGAGAPKTNEGGI